MLRAKKAWHDQLLLADEGLDRAKADHNEAVRAMGGQELWSLIDSIPRLHSSPSLSKSTRGLSPLRRRVPACSGCGTNKLQAKTANWTNSGTEEDPDLGI